MRVIESPQLAATEWKAAVLSEQELRGGMSPRFAGPDKAWCAAAATRPFNKHARSMWLCFASGEYTAMVGPGVCYLLFNEIPAALVVLRR